MDPAKEAPEKPMEDVVLEQHHVDVDVAEQPVETTFAVVKRAIYTRIMIAWSVVAGIFSRASPHKELKEEKTEESASLVVDSSGNAVNNTSNTNETIDIAPPAEEQKPQGNQDS